MKTIINKGQKIINIGNVILLPDGSLSDENTVTTALENPVIQSLVKKGVLVVEEKAAKAIAEKVTFADTSGDNSEAIKAKTKK